MAALGGPLPEAPQDPVTIVRDLSSRVATDDVSSSTLELRALSRQFNQMADRLEESVGIIRRDRDRSRDFLADVSHEPLTPIAAMRTFVELLQGPAGRDQAARSEFLESSAAQLDRLDWLAQNLLELSKLDSGLVLLDLRPEDVRGTIESAVEQQLATAERKGIGVTVALPDHPLRILHDAPRVGQVVSNLVGNALKFTEPGGEVRVSARPEPDGGVRIEVSDTGVGIQPAELPLIFDRFYRGSEMIEARSEGSGLGLAIVKSIVDMHHGTIAVESVEALLDVIATRQIDTRAKALDYTDFAAMRDQYLRQRAERLRQQAQHRRRQRQLVRPRPERPAADGDHVADVDALVDGERVLADGVAADVHLQAASPVEQLQERRLAEVPDGDDPARDRDVRRLGECGLVEPSKTCVDLARALVRTEVVGKWIRTTRLHHNHSRDFGDQTKLLQFHERLTKRCRIAEVSTGNDQEIRWVPIELLA